MYNAKMVYTYMWCSDGTGLNVIFKWYWCTLCVYLRWYSRKKKLVLTWQWWLLFEKHIRINSVILYFHNVRLNVMVFLWCKHVYLSERLSTSCLVWLDPFVSHVCSSMPSWWLCFDFCHSSLFQVIKHVLYTDVKNTCRYCNRPYLYENVPNHTSFVRMQFIT